MSRNAWLQARKVKRALPTADELLMIRIGLTAIAASAGAIALLLLTSLPTIIAAALPLTAGVLFIERTSGIPDTGAASIDPKRVERAVNRILLFVVATTLVAVIATRGM